MHRIDQLDTLSFEFLQKSHTDRLEKKKLEAAAACQPITPQLYLDVIEITKNEIIQIKLRLKSNAQERKIKDNKTPKYLKLMDNIDKFFDNLEQNSNLLREQLEKDKADAKTAKDKAKKKLKKEKAKAKQLTESTVTIHEFKETLSSRTESEVEKNQAEDVQTSRPAFFSEPVPENDTRLAANEIDTARQLKTIQKSLIVNKPKLKKEIVVTKRLNPYGFKLMCDLANDLEKDVFGKIYLSKEGKYAFVNTKGKLQEGELDQDLMQSVHTDNDLLEKFDDTTFEKRIMTKINADEEQIKADALVLKQQAAQEKHEQRIAKQHTEKYLNELSRKNETQPYSPKEKKDELTEEAEDKNNTHKKKAKNKKSPIIKTTMTHVTPNEKTAPIIADVVKNLWEQLDSSLYEDQMLVYARKKAIDLAKFDHETLIKKYEQTISRIGYTKAHSSYIELIDDCIRSGDAQNDQYHQLRVTLMETLETLMPQKNLLKETNESKEISAQLDPDNDSQSSAKSNFDKPSLLAPQCLFTSNSSSNSNTALRKEFKLNPLSVHFTPSPDVKMDYTNSTATLTSSPSIVTKSIGIQNRDIVPPFILDLGSLLKDYSKQNVFLGGGAVPTLYLQSKDLEEKDQYVYNDWDVRMFETYELTVISKHSFDQLDQKNHPYLIKDEQNNYLIWGYKNNTWQLSNITSLDNDMKQVLDKKFESVPEHQVISFSAKDLLLPLLKEYHHTQDLLFDYIKTLPNVENPKNISKTKHPIIRFDLRDGNEVHKIEIALYTKHPEEDCDQILLQKLENEGDSNISSLIFNLTNNKFEITGSLESVNSFLQKQISIINNKGINFVFQRDVRCLLRHVLKEEGFPSLKPKADLYRFLNGFVVTMISMHQFKGDETKPLLIRDPQGEYHFWGCKDNVWKKTPIGQANLKFSPHTVLHLLPNDNIFKKLKLTHDFLPTIDKSPAFCFKGLHADLSQQKKVATFIIDILMTRYDPIIATEILEKHYHMFQAMTGILLTQGLLPFNELLAPFTKSEYSDPNSRAVAFCLCVLTAFCINVVLKNKDKTLFDRERILYEKLYDWHFHGTLYRMIRNDELILLLAKKICSADITDKKSFNDSVKLILGDTFSKLMQDQKAAAPFKSGLFPAKAESTTQTIAEPNAAVVTITPDGS